MYVTIMIVKESLDELKRLIEQEWNSVDLQRINESMHGNLEVTLLVDSKSSLIAIYEFVNGKDAP